MVLGVGFRVSTEVEILERLLTQLGKLYHKPKVHDAPN